jgi:aspartate oxidase
MPRPLISEALRGEGAVLRDDDGVAFMAREHPLADLAPRDIVARAITRRLNERGLAHVWLDATAIESFPTRFPTIWRGCQTVGLDPRRDWLPVAPAAHYLSGGICVDLDGASVLPGLWACGEAACSGVHGANRLASNSLLDGLVFAARAVEAILRGKDAPEPTGVLRGIPEGIGELAPVRVTRPDLAALAAVGGSARDEVQRVMTRDAGVLRDEESLERALAALEAMHPADPEVRNLCTVSTALVRAALARRESRGTHTRVDHPETREAYSGRFVFRGSTAPLFVPLPGAGGRSAAVSRSTR